MTDHSEKQQHELIRLGHPNIFSRTPEINRDIWIAVKKNPVRCIEMFRVVTRSGIVNSDFTCGQAGFEPYMRTVMEAEGDRSIRRCSPVFLKLVSLNQIPGTRM